MLMSTTAGVTATSAPTFDNGKLRQASYWVLGGYVAGQILRLASNLILTRLLAPDLFGLMAVANIVISGVQMLSDMGIQKNIIQSHSSVSRVFLNTAWVLQIFRGFSLAAIVSGFGLILWFIGPSLGSESVYAHQDLPLIFAVLACNLIISGFRSTKAAMANRQLLMGKITAIELTSQCVAVVAMIILASYSPTVWALVAGTIISSVFKISAENIFLPGERNRLQWNNKYAREIFHFGKWIFVTSLLSYWVLGGDRIILGANITAHEMGIYSIAIFIVGAVRDGLAAIMHRVFYPVISSCLREGGDALGVYYRFRLPLDLCVCGLCGFLFVAGDEVISILYDDRYLNAGKFITILAVSLLADRYNGLSIYFLAKGTPRKTIPVTFSRAVMLAIGLPLVFAKFGFFGAVIFLGVYPLLIVPLQLYQKYRAGLLRISSEVAYTVFIFPGLVAGHLFQWLFTYFVN